MTYVFGLPAFIAPVISLILGVVLYQRGTVWPSIWIALLIAALLGSAYVIFALKHMRSAVGASSGHALVMLPLLSAAVTLATAGGTWSIIEIVVQSVALLRGTEDRLFAVLRLFAALAILGIFAVRLIQTTSTARRARRKS